MTQGAQGAHLPKTPKILELGKKLAQVRGDKKAIVKLLTDFANDPEVTTIELRSLTTLIER